jgi:hypothetical protein
MSSTLFGRGTFLQTGNRSRQDQLDKQIAELRSFAVAATQEIQLQKTKIAAQEAASGLPVQATPSTEPQISASPSVESSVPALVVAAAPEPK